jgi:putative Mg2+ transporter-C (MgtC) family protein
LSLFRWIEGRIPTEFYANFSVRFARNATMPEPELRALIASLGFSIHNLTYRLAADGQQFEYRMVLRAVGSSASRALSDALKADPKVLEYRIAPASD